MSRPVGPIGELGERVSGTLALVRSSRAPQRDAIRSEVVASATRLSTANSSPSKRAIWAVAAAAMVALSTGYFLHFSQRPLRFTAGGATGQLQAWLAASAGRSMPIRFSDGSAFEVRPMSRVRVVDASSGGARIAIERGELHAEIVPRTNGAWWIISGPFFVHVTGTIFDVRWDPSAERFAVSVTRGSVEVTGPMIRSARTVVAGQRLAADVVRGRLLEATATNESEPFADLDGEAATRVVSNSVEATSSEKSAPTKAEQVGLDVAVTPSTHVPTVTRATNVSERVSSEWQRLAHAGKLKEAYASAENQGFSSLCGSASAADLLLLGDAARLSGRPDRATDAFLSLRRRFPSDSRRAAAAFALGKVAFDQRHAFAEAASWFATSLQEQPGGSLSREASGRLIEAQRSSGDIDGARRTAKTYLEKYPDGPHARVAHLVLE